MVAATHDLNQLMEVVLKSGCIHEEGALGAEQQWLML